MPTTGADRHHFDPLKSERIQSRVERLPGWSFTPDGRSIRLERRFEPPLDALRFLVRVLDAAGRRGLAPRVTHTLGEVDITLWNPDAGAVTEREVDFAAEINTLDRQEAAG